MQFPSADQFETYYEEHLRYKLQEVDKLRKKIIINYSIICVVIFTGFVFEAVTWMLLGILFIVIFVFWYTNRYGVSFQTFDKQHQSVITANVAAFIYNGFRYDHDRYLKLKDVRNGMLIHGEPRQFSGSNYLEATLGSQHFQSSLIYAYSNEKDRAGMQMQHSHFNGIAAVVSLPLSIHGHILVVNDSSLQESLMELSGGQKHHVVNEEFFTSYSDEDIFNRFLSPSVWLLIKNYTEAANARIMISMQDGSLCIGLPQHNKSYVRSELFKSVVDKNACMIFFRDLLFMVQLSSAIEKINLQTA